MSIPRRSSGELYNVLEVEKDASNVQIKRAYHKKALQLHPDKTGGTTTEAFKAVQEANAILSDPEKRKLYDTFGRSGMKKMEEYEVGGVAATVLTNPKLVLMSLYFAWQYFLLLLLFVILGCVKLDYKKDWSWFAVFTPLFVDCVIYIIPLGLMFFYTSMMVRKPRLAALGLLLILQALAFVFIAKSMDVEAQRMDYHANTADYANAAAAYDRKQNAAGKNSKSYDKYEKESNLRDAEAFRSWEHTFIIQLVTMGVYVVFSLLSLSPEDIRQEKQLEEDWSEADIASINLSSPVYWRIVARRIFTVLCNVTFVVLLKLRMCGDIPTLSFHIIFFPLLLSVGLFPFIDALSALFCGSRGSSCMERLCNFSIIVFITYFSMFTFIMVAERLERTYNPNSFLSFTSPYGMGAATNPPPPDVKSPNHPRLDERLEDYRYGSGNSLRPLPSAFMCMSLVITGLSLISCVFCIIISTVAGASRAGADAVLNATVGGHSYPGSDADEAEGGHHHGHSHGHSHEMRENPSAADAKTHLNTDVKKKPGYGAV